MTGRRKISLLLAGAISIGIIWMWQTPAQLSDSTDQPDRCPVCGMFVSKYPEWIARINFTSGPPALFDGPKDFFKFYFFRNQYCDEKEQKRQIESIFVTDYYTVQLIDAKNAAYVVGSDVLGPMGHELVPFESGTAAHEFSGDHSGRVLGFEQITPDLITDLD